MLNPYASTVPPNDNMLTSTESGALVTSTYDAANRLTTVIDGTAVTSYTYDRNGTQVRVEEAGGTVYTWGTDGEACEIRRRSWSGHHRLGCRRLPSGESITMAVKNYINAGGEIFGEVSGGTRKNYVRDALGSVVAVTDAANNKVYSAQYKPYGSVLTSTGVELSFTWVGTLGYLKAAGVTYSEFSVRARFYSNKSARWTRLDPIWPRAAAFVYFDASPTNLVDVTGLTGGLQSCGAGLHPHVTMSVKFPKPTISQAVCDCEYDDVTSTFSIKIVFNCTAVQRNDCGCDIDQWICGTILENRKNNPSILKPCGGI